MNATEKTVESLVRYCSEGFSALVGKFHAHLTVQIDADRMQECKAFCRNHKVKFTVVDLQKDDRQQRDVMITVHFRDQLAGAVGRISQRLSELCELADQAGLPVQRAKLEHESLPTVTPFSKENYHEVHIKLQINADVYEHDFARLNQLGDRYGFVPSRNPFQRTESTVIQFANLRIYQGDQSSADATIENVQRALADNDFQVVETKRETVVFDTAHQMDAWWA